METWIYTAPSHSPWTGISIEGDKLRSNSGTGSEIAQSSCAITLGLACVTRWALCMSISICSPCYAAIHAGQYARNQFVPFLSRYSTIINFNLCRFAPSSSSIFCSSPSYQFDGSFATSIWAKCSCGIYECLCFDIGFVEYLSISWSSRSP